MIDFKDSNLRTWRITGNDFWWNRYLFKRLMLNIFKKFLKQFFFLSTNHSSMCNITKKPNELTKTSIMTIIYIYIYTRHAKQREDLHRSTHVQSHSDSASNTPKSFQLSLWVFVFEKCILDRRWLLTLRCVIVADWSSTMTMMMMMMLKQQLVTMPCFMIKF